MTHPAPFPRGDNPPQPPAPPPRGNNPPQPPAVLRVLAVGDSYMPAGVFTAALAGLRDAVCVTELQLGATGAAPPRTESERALREYAGDPADLVAAVPGHDALLVHGAPV